MFVVVDLSKPRKCITGAKDIIMNGRVRSIKKEEEFKETIVEIIKISTNIGVAISCFSLIAVLCTPLMFSPFLPIHCGLGQAITVKALFVPMSIPLVSI